MSPLHCVKTEKFFALIKRYDHRQHGSADLL